MDTVNQEVLDAIDAQDSIRIVADVPTDLMNSADPLVSATDIMDPFITQWATKHHTRLLLVDLYPRHTYMVVDVNNRLYDYNTAIPVYILRLSRRGIWSFFRRPVDDRRIAREIAEVHRCNGWNPLPFLADHIKGSVYLSPRSIQLSSEKAGMDVVVLEFCSCFRKV